MELYTQAGVDPRSGARALKGGRVHISVARRLAEAAQVSLGDILDLSELEAADSAA